MDSLITTPSQLTEQTISKVYEIHKRVYFDKGIGHPKEVWCDNLFRGYQNAGTKYVQIFRVHETTESIVDGYSICTGPVDCAGDIWMKIIEAGLTLKGGRRDIPNAFTQMLTMLVTNPIGEYRGDINFVAEVDIQSEKIASILLDRVGFKHMLDKTLAHTVVRAFLKDIDFRIKDTDPGLIIERRTAIKNEYVGQIAVYETT